MLKTKLITIDNKLYIKGVVVLTWSKDKDAPIFKFSDIEFSDKKFKLTSNMLHIPKNIDGNFYNVAIVELLEMNEKFKVGDFVQNTLHTNECSQEIFEDNLEYYNKRNERYGRILATTDKSIVVSKTIINKNFHSPSVSFLESYIESECTIKDVFVQVDSEIGICEQCGATQFLSYGACNYNGICHGSVVHMLKTNSNSNIIIKKLQQNFKRDELLNSLIKMKGDYDEALINFQANMTKTIEFNLQEWIYKNI